MAFRGDSMRGTFRDGDRLGIELVPFDSLQIGDVAAFRSGGKSVAHRIAGRSGGLFQTRGDGNLRCDASLLGAEELIGKVTSRDRGNSCVVVAGGLRGRQRAWLWHGLGRADRCFRWLFSPAYRLLRVSRLASLLWKPRIVAARFACPAGSLTKFIHRGETVASWAPEERRWTCRKPYDLVLEPPGR